MAALAAEVRLSLHEALFQQPLEEGRNVIFTPVALSHLHGNLGDAVFGAKRLARHLWRMCFAWFIASASIFLARPHLFPTVLRKTGTLYLLSILPLILMIFWLIRILSSGRKKLHEAEV
jgi:hypothetical protein